MVSENFIVFIEFLTSYAWEVVKKKKYGFGVLTC